MSEQKEIEIFKHELVPQHILLSQDEANEVLSWYRIQPYQLPHIKTSDPAIQVIEGKMGDVIKVIRKSSTSGEVIAYRYVVNG